jgi:hypothetical protein
MASAEEKAAPLFEFCLHAAVFGVPLFLPRR